MKIVAIYNAFDATELLEASITQIKPHINYVVAIYQKKSYWGNNMALEDKVELNRLVDIGLIDELLIFEPDSTKYSRAQECDKRNAGIDYVKKLGYSHYISMDCDELYDTEQFGKAKEYIKKNGINNSYCTYINYYRDFSHYVKMPFIPGVNFINRTIFPFTYDGPAPLPTDPTRRVKNQLGLAEYVFKPEELRMHHASWIRKDIKKKLDNWSAKNHFKPELINRCVERYKTFKEGQKALQLFNVPNNEVKIKKLDIPFIHPNLDWIDPIV
jgi:hypothetical protein